MTPADPADHAERTLGTGTPAHLAIAMALTIDRPMAFAVGFPLGWAIWVSQQPALTAGLSLFWVVVNLAVSHWIKTGRERPSPLHTHIFGIRAIINGLMLVTVIGSAGPQSSAWLIGISIATALPLLASERARVPTVGFAVACVLLGLAVAGADPHTYGMAASA